jgi:hypothetical protein
VAKLSLTPIGSRYGSIDALNANFDAIEAAIENTLSLDNTAPNSLNDDLDLDSNRIINLGNAINNSDAVTLQQVSNLVNAASSGLIVSLKQFITATAGQTVFNLTSFTYFPGGNNLSVYIDGVRQYVGLSYTETNSSRVTFTGGLTVGSVVEFVSNEAVSSTISVSSGVQYQPAGTGAVATTVQAKLRESVSVLDFIPVALQTAIIAGTSTTDVHSYIQAAIDSLGATGGTVFFPKGTYKITTSLTVSTDAVTLQGTGTAVGNAGVSETGASVINCIGVNCITVSTYINNFTMDSLYIVSTNSTGGSALSINTVSGAINNLTMRNVYVQRMAYALYVDTGSSIVGAQIELCQFSYNTANHVIYQGGSLVGVVLFLSCRFEPAGFGYSLFQNNTTTIALGEQRFINCTFESSNSAYAVNVGANAPAMLFQGCHFENNSGPTTQSGPPTSNGCDIFMGGGNTNVLVENCAFSYPQITALNFYNIINTAGSILTAIGNTVYGQNRTGYVGFVSSSFPTRTTLINNWYDEASGTALDYTSGMINPVRFNDYQGSLKWGAVNGPIVKSITTTNATPTQIWGGEYLIQQSSAMFAEAYVVGTDVTGAVYCAFTTRVLVTTNAAGTGTIRGTTTETGIASGAQAAAFALVGALSTTGLVLNVTGVAATTIKWMVNVTLNKIGF